jgi:hypothetical protein
METGMQNLGSGGEAKASPADRDDADSDAPRADRRDETDQSERGGTMDAALGAENDPDLDTGVDEDGTIARARPSLGANEAAPYGETIENAPAPSETGAP